MIKRILLSLMVAYTCVICSVYAQAQTLHQAIQFAIQTNPEILAVLNQRNANNETIHQAFSGYLPTIDIDAGFGKELSTNPTTQAIDDQSNLLLSRREAGVFLVENLFNGFQTTNEVARTGAETAASSFELESTANDLALDITEQYLDVILRSKLVALARANLAEHQRILSMIRDRKEAGLAREADLDQAVGREALAQTNLITSESNLYQAEIRYERLVGMPANHLTMPNSPRYPFIPKNEYQGVAYALKHHPALKGALEDVRAAVAQHLASYSDRYPSVDLVLSASRNENLDGIPGVNNDNMAMLRASYNLYRGGANLAAQRQTAFQVQEAIEIKNNTIRQIREAIHLAWIALTIAKQRVVHLDTYRKATYNTRSAYIEQFKIGKRSLLDLLDTQSELYQANIDFYTAKFDEMFARYRLLNGTGRLLGYLRIRLPIQVKPNRWHRLPGISMPKVAGLQPNLSMRQPFVPWEAGQPIQR